MELLEDVPNPLDSNLKKSIPINTEVDLKYQEKKELDLKDEEVEEIQKSTNLIFKGNIGYGGFSTVKLAHSEKNNCYFAIKIINLLNPKKFKKKTYSKRKEFVDQEFQINYSSKHKNIVKLYGSFFYKNYYLLIMEYLTRKDLKSLIKKYIKKGEPMSEVLCANFFIDIMNGLRYLKNMNIIHRDIKPENIMISSDYTAKVGDFSLSRKIECNKKFTTSRSGTIPYLPPEAIKEKSTQIKPNHIEKLDVFSFGVLLYYMIFFEHPFRYRVSFILN